MSIIPTGAELSRPFLPTQDFELSKRFYEALGFEKVLDGEVAIFRVGAGGFILQRFYQKDLAENLMMQLMVDDLDAWWTHLNALDLPRKIRREDASSAGHAAVGASRRLPRRPVRDSLACVTTARRRSPRLMPAPR